MTRRVKRIKTESPVVGYYGPEDTPDTLDYTVEYCWVEEPATESWTRWECIGFEQDEDPTYYAEHAPNGNLMRPPTLRALHPHRRKRSIWERKLVRRWVDPDEGPMAKIIDVQQVKGYPY